MSKNLSGDNVKLNIGDGPDLQLSHSGTNSVIDNNTGGLYIRNNVGGDVGGDSKAKDRNKSDEKKEEEKDHKN